MDTRERDAQEQKLKKREDATTLLNIFRELRGAGDRRSADVQCTCTQVPVKS